MPAHTEAVDTPLPRPVRAVWGEVLLKNIGMLKFGRMPSHFGLGIAANAGDDLDEPLDGILYGTPPTEGEWWAEARVHNLDDPYGVFSDWHPVQLLVTPDAEYLPIKAQFATGVPVASISQVAIIGAGAIGIEFSHIYRILGSEVTIVEMMPHIVPGEDAEVTEVLRKLMEKRGIRILTSSRMQEIQTDPHDDL